MWQTRPRNVKGLFQSYYSEFFIELRQPLKPSKHLCTALFIASYVHPLLLCSSMHCAITLTNIPLKTKLYSCFCWVPTRVSSQFSMISSRNLILLKLISPLLPVQSPARPPGLNSLGLWGKKKKKDSLKSHLTIPMPAYVTDEEDET